MKRPDWIYLQWEGDGEGEVTWCVDKINDDDIKYICDEAAEARIAELELVLRMVEYDRSIHLNRCPWCGGCDPAYPADAYKGHFPNCPRQKVLNE